MPKCLFRKLMFFFLVFLAGLSSFAQSKKEILVGYAETYEKLPKLAFTSSTLAEYDRCPDRTYIVKPKLKASKTHHVINTKGKQFNLKKYKNYGNEGFSGYELLGYYPQLKMYAVTDNLTSEHLGFGTFVLIDSLTHYQYAIVSIGDGAVETPVPSVKGKHLIYFYNWPYEDNSCFIGLLKVNDRKNPIKMLIEKASFDTKEWAVEAIKWLNDDTFFIKAFKVKAQQRHGTRLYQYLKCSLAYQANGKFTQK